MVSMDRCGLVPVKKNTPYFLIWICLIFPEHPLLLHQPHTPLRLVPRWKCVPLSALKRCNLMFAQNGCGVIQDGDVDNNHGSVVALLKRNDDLASALNQSDFAETFAQVVHSIRLLLLLLLPLLLLLLLHLPQELLLNIGDIRKREIGISNCFPQLLSCFPSQ